MCLRVCAADVGIIYEYSLPILFYLWRLTSEGRYGEERLGWHSWHSSVYLWCVDSVLTTHSLLPPTNNTPLHSKWWVRVSVRVCDPCLLPQLHKLRGMVGGGPN